MQLTVARMGCGSELGGTALAWLTAGGLSYWNAPLSPGAGALKAVPSAGSSLIRSMPMFYSLRLAVLSLRPKAKVRSARFSESLLFLDYLTEYAVCNSCLIVAYNHSDWYDHANLRRRILRKIRSTMLHVQGH